jgi:hypothetical protein
MTPALRVKFGLLSIVTVFLAAFAWNAAQGQFRPPRSPFNPAGRPPGTNPPGMNPPGMNPPGGFNGGMGRGGIGLGWRCPKCGQTGAGAIPPGTCPGCGVRFVNGMGNGSAGGIMGGQVGPNPPMPPGGVNPPPNTPPGGFVPPPMNPGAPAGNPDNQVNVGSSIDNSSNSSESSGKGKMIALVIGIIVVGVFVLLGGTFLMIYTMKSNSSGSSRRRRRRREDDED